MESFNFSGLLLLSSMNSPMSIWLAVVIMFVTSAFFGIVISAVMVSPKVSDGVRLLFMFIGLPGTLILEALIFYALPAIVSRLN